MWKIVLAPTRTSSCNYFIRDTNLSDHKLGNHKLTLIAQITGSTFSQKVPTSSDLPRSVLEPTVRFKPFCLAR